MVCGVDCHRGDANCNGYCHDAKIKHPPAATPAQVLDWARRDASEKAAAAAQADEAYKRLLAEHASKAA
jgi:hypothetical protein